MGHSRTCRIGTFNTAKSYKHEMNEYAGKRKADTYPKTIIIGLILYTCMDSRTFLLLRTLACNFFFFFFFFVRLPPGSET